MSVSISERGDTAISDIIAGGPGFELRLKQFREAAAQSEEAKGIIRRANALMHEAEEKIALAAAKMAEVEIAAAAARAEHERADARVATINAWCADVWALDGILAKLK